MLVFYAVMASVNLCAGYALALWLGAPTGSANQELERLPPLPRTAKKPLANAVELKPQAAEEEEITSTALSAYADQAELMAGLAAFRDQLSEMGRELRDSVSDDQAFDACAVRLQQANHSYLDQAKDALEQSEARGLTEANHPAQQALRAGTAEITTLSSNIDGLIDQGLTASTRPQLLASSESLAELVAETSQACAAAQNYEELDPENGLATLEHLISQLAELCGGASPDTPTLAAAVRVDPLRNSPQADELRRRIHRQLPMLTGSPLISTQTSSDPDRQQLLCVFPGEQLDSVTAKIEQLRQLVEAVEFDADGQAVQATVSCAIAECATTKAPTDVLAMLEEALDESKRLGVNRTYHHDGAFATPLPATDANVKPQRVVV